MSSRMAPRIRTTFTFFSFGQSISTTVSANSAAVDRWIQDLNDDIPRYVGFEFEFDYNTQRIATVQLCVGNECLIFRLLRESDIPPSLEQFLGDPNNTFVGTSLPSKILRLGEQCPFDADVCYLDFGENEGLLRERKQGLFASIELGLAETDWDRLPDQRLSNNQMTYAALHVFLNLLAARLLGVVPS